MLDKLKGEYEELTKLASFKEFIKKEPDSFLCSAFTVIEGEKQKDWQLDFFDPKTHKVTSFNRVDGSFVMSEPQDVFQKEKTDLEMVDLEKVDVGLENAFEIIKKLREEKYPDEKPTKIIIVLQMYENKLVWNITYLTVNFTVLNVKVDAVGGGVISDKLEHIFKFKKEA